MRHPSRLVRALCAKWEWLRQGLPVGLRPTPRPGVAEATTGLSLLQLSPAGRLKPSLEVDSRTDYYTI